MTGENRRWSDDRLEDFYDKFQEHVKAEHAQQQEIYDALFRKEDDDANEPAGVIQLMGRIDKRLKAMEIAADRQKTFLGGIVFAGSSVVFFFSDTAQNLITWIKK